jgi:hypothetical protein
MIRSRSIKAISLILSGPLFLASWSPDSKLFLIGPQIAQIHADFLRQDS